MLYDVLLFAAVVSPPKSPTPDLDLEVIQALSTSSSSSVEVVSDPGLLSPDRLTDQVQDKISRLVIEPDCGEQPLSVVIVFIAAVRCCSGKAMLQCLISAPGRLRNSKVFSLLRSFEGW